MKIFAAMLMMGMAVGGWGQQPITCTTAGSSWVESGPTCHGEPTQSVQPKPLKCVKYQHVEPSRLGCAVGVDVGYCDRIIPAQCADDMHEVTEREWQAMVDSIRILTKLNDIHEARLRTLEQHQQDTKEFIRGVIDGASRKAKP